MEENASLLPRTGQTPPELYRDKEYHRKQEETKAAIKRMRALSLARRLNQAKRAVRVLAKLTATAARRSSAASIAESVMSDSVGVPTPRGAALSSGVGAMFISSDTHGPDTQFSRAGHSLRIVRGARGGRRPSVDMLTKQQEMELVAPQHI